MPTVTVRLSQIELTLMDELATELKLNRTELVRRLIRDGRESHGLRERTAVAFVESLKATMPDDAVIVIQLDDMFDPFATVDGEKVDLYLPARGVTIDGEDFVRVYLGDLEGDTRLFLGVLPLRTGVPLHIPVASLSPRMQPRAMEYWTGS